MRALKWLFNWKNINGQVRERERGRKSCVLYITKCLFTNLLRLLLATGYPDHGSAAVVVYRAAIVTVLPFSSVLQDFTEFGRKLNQ